MIKDNNLSNSAIRVLNVYKMLFASSATFGELCEDFSADSLSVYFNTLNALEIKISTLTKPYRYYISENCNLIGFDEKDILFFSTMKSLAGQYFPIKTIMELNNSLYKLCSYTDAFYKAQLQNIIDMPPFGCDLHSKISFFQECIQKEITLLVYYNSPKSGKKILEILPLNLDIRNLKLYLWCKDENISDYRCLRVERIDEIKMIKGNINDKVKNCYAICEISNMKAINKFWDIDVIGKGKDRTVVKLHSSNKFEIIQMLLSLGKNCKILEPEDIKTSFIKVLKSMKGLYD